MHLTDTPKMYRPTRRWRLSPLLFALFFMAIFSPIAIWSAMTRPTTGHVSHKIGEPLGHYVSAEQALAGWEATQVFFLLAGSAVFALGALGSLIRHRHRILVSVKGMTSYSWLFFGEVCLYSPWDKIETLEWSPDRLRVEQVFRGRSLQQARQEQIAVLVPRGGERFFAFLYQALAHKPVVASLSHFYVYLDQFPAWRDGGELYQALRAYAPQVFRAHATTDSR